MKYKIYATRIKLFDSYLVPKADYAKELGKIRNLHPSCRIWGRSEGSIRREWAAHSWAYKHNINREKTGDVDLEYEPKWYMNLFYGIVGTIALWLIK